ncbi:hypothetical protein [Ktedonospora formicarum]|uniref:SLATT domain-containing protein n=1 Tax=Ktedonospora formicarum TaxID=2778364 RepID=A0A8J3I3U5_9CHLR|nr:hypothetical protein [Ktedonospora formicarum]GHO49667.1 hypothetical protein KSX_78300 [Ktedonospora formicarum]
MILGSAIATAIVNISELPRWETSIVTVIVAATSGILVAYKFKDRSTTLQQTGDLIKAKYESFRLHLDEYDTSDIEARYKLLTRRLKRLKEEQRSRELLLEQSPETKQAQPAQA